MHENRAPGAELGTDVEPSILTSAPAELEASALEARSCSALDLAFVGTALAEQATGMALPVPKARLETGAMRCGALATPGGVLHFASRGRPCDDLGGGGCCALRPTRRHPRRKPPEGCQCPRGRC